MDRTPLEFQQDLGVRKLESLTIVRRCLRDPAFSGSGRTPTCDGQTDGWHRATAYITL